MGSLPRSRTTHVRTSRGEHGALIVYDLEHDTGHVLNVTTAAVYDLADGTRPPAAIAKQLEKRFGYAVSEDIVQLALQELAGAKLLAAGARPRGVSRRDLMRRFALSAGAATLLPGLGSIENLSQVVSPAPRPLGSSHLPGAGYHFVQGPYGYGYSSPAR